MTANITQRHKRKAEVQAARQEGKQDVRRMIKNGDDDCSDYREEVIALVTGCSAKSGVVGGNGGGMPEIAQAWESCARNSLPRRWNAVQHIHSEKRMQEYKRGTYSGRATGR